MEAINWWLGSVSFDGFTGRPTGPPEWPFRGGLLRQPARLAEAAQVLAGEWPHLRASKKVAAIPAEEPGRVRKLKA